MAVQAQYPSSLLFHDRGEPERKEMDLPRAPRFAGVSPEMYFPSGGASGINRRKRSMEAMAPPPAKEELVNLFTLQPQQSTSFVNMAQLHNRVSASPSRAPATLVSTGLRLALDEQQQQQESKRLKSLCYSSSPTPFVSFSDELAGQMKRQDEELDRFIQDQGEQLRRAMADRVRRHNRALLVAAERSAARRLREKALEAEREARRGAELEERLARLRSEAAAWQAKALSEQAAAPGRVLVVRVRRPSPHLLGPRLPHLPPEAGHRGSPSLQAPQPLRRLLRRRRYGRGHGVPRLPLRPDRGR
uniref:Uncharacterized protein n=1 Tax=Oryza brachyantha TaxID=4533 RepID=J3LFZ0_ORYBR